MRYILIFILTVLSGCQQPNSLSGTAKAIDGDSLMLNGATKIRLWGIDAPEYNQKCQYKGQNISCGLKAKDYLQSLIKGRKLYCYQKDIDRYKRIVALCYDEQNIEINKAMVKAGWAFDYTRYSGANYRVTEYQAKQQNLGIWNYQFDSPVHWRKTNNIDKGK